MPGESIIPELLTKQQAAVLCGVSDRTLMRLADAGRAPPPVKLGADRRAAVRWQRSRLLAWIDAGCPPVPDGNGEEV